MQIHNAKKLTPICLIILCYNIHKLPIVLKRMTNTGVLNQVTLSINQKIHNTLL